MSSSYQTFNVFLLSTCLFFLTYTITFLFLLGTRLVGKGIEEGGNWLVSQAISCVLLFVISFEAIVFIFLDRQLSGKLLFFVTLLGATVAALTITGTQSDFRTPIERALEAKDLSDKGGYIGNLIILLINILCFYLPIPSFL